MSQRSEEGRLSSVAIGVAAALEPALADPARSRAATILAWGTVALALALGVADFVLAVRVPLSMALCAALTGLVVPWGLQVLRSEDGPAGSARDRRRWRLFALYAANALLVLAFTAAKWLALVSALRDPDGGYVEAYRTYTVAVVVLLVLGVVARGGRLARLVAASAEHPARLMAVSFGLTGLLGGLLLALPISIRRVSEVSLLDSLFMSLSAVCVTGLTTVNVAETYTFTGQIVLCVLVQVGGLGIMALSAAVTMLAGQRLGVKSSAVLAELVDARSLADLKRTIATIILVTLVVEALGAALLYAEFVRIPGIVDDEGPLAGAGGPLWAAVFHSVSAFCNAGLSNFKDGMVPFAGSPTICQIVAALVILGGLGFPVTHELLSRAIARLRGRRPVRVTLGTRIALVTTAALFVGVASAYAVLERSASFAGLGVVDRLNVALFQSAARTSGFATIDVSAMRPATLLFTCVGMFIGANPGSTGGGIKTTTVAVLFAAYRGDLRGHRPRLWDRTIPEAIVRRAMGVAFLSTGIVVTVVFLLLLLEEHAPIDLAFEVVSAFSTTGLSTGVTQHLSVAGKLLLAATMLAGRVGPLTLALALSARERIAAYELPEERVMIG